MPELMLDSPGRGPLPQDEFETGMPAPGGRRRAGDTASSARVSAARAAADRHSRRVRRLRIILPLIGVVILVGVAGRLAWGYFRSGLGMSNVLFSKDGVTMVEPHVAGQSGTRSYEVNAARAFQAFDDPKKVRMEEVRARMEMADRQWATIESPKGGYDSAAQSFHFEGGVTAVTSQGYQLTLERADMDLGKGDMRGTGQVRVLANGMTINSDSINIIEHGSRIQFADRVVVKIDSQSAKTAKAP